MQISTSWLKEWVDVGADVRGLAHELTMAGLEVEGLAPAAPPIKGVVVGEVRDVQPHPDAEKLKVCHVYDGQQTLQIVCGASNVRAGMKAPLATVGAELPGGVRIKAARLRGVESAGMLCSAKELGLGEDVPGLLELPLDVETGADLVEALSLDDTILELNLTPNRGDCMSMQGVAREVAAIRRTKLSVPTITHVPNTVTDELPLRIEAHGACRYFSGRVIRSVRPDVRSPLWMRERLRRAGIRPLNALVDVTNYVMIELGQPMHAYDLRRLAGTITARQARAGEVLTLLDGGDIKLEPDVLVIADDQKVLGLAGIMGGLASGIADDTTDVFLEAAHFTPAAVAGRGRRYGLVTDASQRFERGVDPALPRRAIERATQLLIEIAGGSAGPTRNLGPLATLASSGIRIRRKRVAQVLGVSVAASDIEDSLARIELAARPVVAGEEWAVTPPSWRFDLRMEEDLIEEVLRIYGFDRIPGANAPMLQAIPELTETRAALERIADMLVARGYQEAITYSFVDPELQSTLLPGVEALALSNPISADLAVMRASLWPGLVRALRDNQHRQQARVRLFETGRKYVGSSGVEVAVLAGIAAGPAVPEQWSSTIRDVDFYDVKADIEALLALTNDSSSFLFVADQHPSLHPGQTARIVREGVTVGWIGALHPRVVDGLGLTYGAIAYELELARTFDTAIPRAKEISKFPAVRRDIAVVVAERVTFAMLQAAVAKSAGPLLVDLIVFDVFRGQTIEKGKKSIALGLKLQDTSRTLTDEDVDTIVSRVLTHLGSELDAVIRDK